MRTPSDEELIEALKNEQRSAYKYMYERYYRMVANHVVKNNGDDEDAKDLFQDVLVKFIAQIRKPEFTLTGGAKLSTYVFSIAKYTWLMKLRERKLMPSEQAELREEADGSALIAEEEQLLSERSLLTMKIFKTIGDDCQKVLDGFYFRKLSMREIAEDMGYAYDYARLKKNRCLNELRKRVLDSTARGNED